MSKTDNLITNFRKQKSSQRVKVVLACIAMAKIVGGNVQHIQFGDRLNKKNY